MSQTKVLLIKTEVTCFTCSPLRRRTMKLWRFHDLSLVKYKYKSKVLFQCSRLYLQIMKQVGNVNVAISDVFLQLKVIIVNIYFFKRQKRKLYQ